MRIRNQTADSQHVFLLVLQWIWAERCSFVMGPLPAHHNSDGKGQRASNDERHASDDSGDLSGTFTMLVTCGRCLLFRSVGDHARDVRCGRPDPRRQPALGLPCRLPGDRLLVRPSRPAVQCRLRCAPPDAAAICRGTVAAASSTKCVHHAPLTDGSTDIVAWVSSVCVASCPRFTLTASQPWSCI